jgi:hypothetical protein
MELVAYRPPMLKGAGAGQAGTASKAMVVREAGA